MIVACTPAVNTRQEARQAGGPAGRLAEEGLRRSAMTLGSHHLKGLTPCCREASRSRLSGLATEGRGGGGDER